MHWNGGYIEETIFITKQSLRIKIAKKTLTKLVIGIRIRNLYLPEGVASIGKRKHKNYHHPTYNYKSI